MRKRVTFGLLLWLWLLSFSIAAQRAVLNGIITYQNSGRPISNAGVSATGTTPTVSDAFGKFQLVFMNKEPGKVVDIIVSKKGLEVLDRERLRVALRLDPDEPVRIVMRPVGEFERLKKEYAQIAVNAISKNYEQRLEKKEKTINQLNRRKQAALAQVKSLSSALADVDLAQVSAIYRKAFSLFKAGRVGEAAALLDDTKIEQDLPSLMLKARLMIIQFRFADARTYYRKGLKIDPRNFSCTHAFASFFYKQKQYKRATLLFQKALTLAKSEAQRVEALIDLGELYFEREYFQEAERVFNKALAIKRKSGKRDVIRILNSLGYIYYKTQRFKEAERAFKEALSAGKKSSDIAAVLSKLGVLYRKTARFDEAEKTFLNALRNYRLSAKKNRAEYLPGVATSLNNLGLFYQQVKKYPQALKPLAEAKDILEALVKNNPRAFEIDLCQTLITLAAIYIDSSHDSALHSLKPAVRQSLGRAASILEKYPTIPRAQQLLKLARHYLNKMGRRPNPLARQIFFLCSGIISKACFFCYLLHGIN